MSSSNGSFKTVKSSEVDSDQQIDQDQIMDQQLDSDDQETPHISAQPTPAVPHPNHHYADGGMVSIEHYRRQQDQINRLENFIMKLKNKFERNVSKISNILNPKPWNSLRNSKKHIKCLILYN